MSLPDFLEDRLISLGATPEYTGYKYLTSALGMTMRDDSLLTKVTTVLYPSIAQQYGTSAANVERSIRTLLSVVWSCADSAALKQLLGRNYPVQPGNAKFIGIASKRLLLEYRKTRSSCVERSRVSGDD